MCGVQTPSLMDGDCAMTFLRTTVIVITLMNEIFSFILSLLVLIYTLHRQLISPAGAGCVCVCVKTAKENRIKEHDRAPTT